MRMRKFTRVCCCVRLSTVVNVTARPCGGGETIERRPLPKRVKLYVYVACLGLLRALLLL